MRVTQVSGLKVVVETADPDYEYESGNVFIDANISLIPKDSLLKELRVGDYLPVVRNDHANLPFRLSRECVTDFVDEYARQCSDEEECDELLSVYDTDFNGGSRWLSESDFTSTSSTTTSPNRALRRNTITPCPTDCHLC